MKDRGDLLAVNSASGRSAAALPAMSPRVGASLSGAAGALDHRRSPGGTDILGRLLAQ
jgi:hypothetical protein